MPAKIQLYSRLLAPRLQESLADTPAVLIHGPRQSGKTTLARSVGEPRGYYYVSFDDEAIRRAAQNDPIGFVAGLPKRAILDEVQRVPEIFTSLKSVIDRGRSSGRFILAAIFVAAWQSLWAQHSQSALSVADIPRLLRVGSQRDDVHGIGTWWKHRFSATCAMSHAFTHSTHCPGFLRWRPITQRDS